MKKIIITLLLVAGLSACGASEGPSSVAETTTTTTTATEETTTTTTATTTTETPTLDDSESNIEYVGEKTYDDGTRVEAYSSGDDEIMYVMYVQSDDPQTNLKSFVNTVSIIESNFEERNDKPSQLNWWLFHDNDAILNLVTNLNDDGSYSSALGAIWLNDEYEKASKNLDINADNTTSNEVTYPTVYEDDNVTIKFCGIGKDYYDIDDSVIFCVENKNDFDVTIQCQLISLDGVEINDDPTMSDKVPALSKAKVYAAFENGIDNKNPSFISGVLNVIDWSTEHFMPYNATFRNVDV